MCLGVPAICYHRDDTVELKYANASTSTGGAAGDWSTQVVTTFSNEMYPSLAALNSGLAAISMYAGGGSTRLWYFHSTSGHFNGASGTEVDNVGDTGQHSSLAIVNAHPAISYYNVTDTKLMYIRASGAVGGNWPPDPGITVDDSAAVGTYTSLAVCADRPAISYYDATNSDLKVARSSTTTGSSAADWQTETVDSSGNVGQYTSLALVNGCLALSYYRADNKNLKYAILF